MASAPQPSVLHLVTIFRQITSGEIRIPAFQREFVWREKQMIELLESVLKGYPIGSILLWVVHTPVLKTAPTAVTAFPDVPERYPTSYVLDGMQRLSTLFGVFNFGVSTQDTRFRVYFDLEVGEFAHERNGDPLPDTAVPLSALFVPRQLLEHQARLAAMAAGDVLIERLLELQAAFQEYMVPVVTIGESDVARIVGIFEKINSTGTRLDPVDFMRAITWAEDFDLNRSLDALTSSLDEVGFSLDSESVVKCVGLVLGIPPTNEGLLAMQNFSSADLASAFDKALTAIKRVAEFLDYHLQLPTSALVPYEGQLLLLVKTIGLEEASQTDVSKVLSWYWATGFNESLRGKPDHYVVRSIENWSGLVAGDVRGLEPRLRLTEADLVERRLVSGGALSSTFATMLATMQAKSLVTGEYILPGSYLARKSLDAFEPVYSRRELLAVFADLVSARIFANLVVTDRLDARGNLQAAILSAADRGDWPALQSQFIDERAVEAVARGDADEFLFVRAEMMVRRAQQLVDTAT